MHPEPDRPPAEKSREIFRAEFHPAISANPLLAFSTVATESGTIAFTWTGDKGFSVTQSARITVV